MKLMIYAIMDTAAEAFDSPLFFRADGEAIRSFVDGVNTAQANNGLYQHADDYIMYKIGEYETTTGEITGNKPIQILRGKDAKIRENKETENKIDKNGRHEISTLNAAR